jgi:hypothetical protein
MKPHAARPKGDQDTGLLSQDAGQFDVHKRPVNTSHL